MSTEDGYHDEERNPNALLRAIFHNCFGVMEGGLSAEETIKNIHKGIEHFAATTGMRLSMIPPQEENNDQGSIRH